MPRDLFKKKFSKDLKAQLERGYVPKRIGSWAYQMYVEHCGRVDDELEAIMDELSFLEASPEFELPESELKQLVEELENGKSLTPLFRRKQ